MKAMKDISIDKIHPDPEQPRKSFSEESLQSLAVTITKVGIIHPIGVEPDTNDKGFKIVTGDRRFRAAKIAGLEKIPCLIDEFNDEQRLLHRLIENLQREDLNLIERAEGICMLMKNFNYTQRDVAKALGRSESTISEDLSVLKIPEDEREKLRRAEVSKRTAVKIAAEKDPEKQKEITERVVEEGITSEDIKRDKIKDSLNPFVYETKDGKSTVTVKSTKRVMTRKVLMGILRAAYLSVKKGN